MEKKRTYIELLSDEAFKKWVLTPNKERTIFWETQLRSDEALKKEAKKAREIILRLNFQNASLTEVEKDELLQTIISVQNGKHHSKTFVPQLPFRNFLNGLLSKVAAALLILFLTTYLLDSFLDKKIDNNNVETKNTLIVKNTPKGQKSRLTLPDGSELNVNAETELSFEKDFNSGDIRKVFLKGEVFFNIEKLQGKPFKVITNKSEITVLGTSFNVHTASLTTPEHIAVKTGKVQVKLGSQKVLLQPNEMVTIENGKLIKTDKFDNDKIFGWKEGILVFDNEDFEAIIKKLENWYGASFEIKGNRNGLIKFSGTYKNKSLEHILQGISFAADFDFEIDDKIVKINFN